MIVLINYNVKKRQDSNKKGNANLIEQSGNTNKSGANNNNNSANPNSFSNYSADTTAGLAKNNSGQSANAPVQAVSANKASSTASYATRIKNMVTPSAKEVQTRNYALKYGEGTGFNINDEDIQYKNGNVYIRGVNVGKPDRVDENGVSYMSEDKLKGAIDTIKNSQGTNVDGYEAQYDKAVNQNLNARETQAEQLEKQSNTAFDWYKTDPLATDYGKQVMSTYKALGQDDANNSAASAGTGANIDSSSLASMTAAQEARKLAGINAVTQYWAAAGEGQRGVMNDTQTAWNNYIVAGNDTATSIKDNQRADTESQNQTNELDANITGRIPIDVERRNSNYFYKDPVTGEYKLYYNGENADYSALANEAEAVGDLDTANKLRGAAEYKAQTNANYAGQINNLVPSQRAESNERYNTSVSQSEAQKERDFQKEILELQANLEDKAEKGEISQSYLDNIFKLAYNDAANNGNVERLNRLSEWMNNHGYTVPEFI